MEQVGYSNSRNDPGSHLKLLRVTAVADLLGLSRKGIWALLRRGAIGYVRIGRRAIRISEQQLIEFLERWPVSSGNAAGGNRRRLIGLSVGTRW